MPSMYASQETLRPAKLTSPQATGKRTTWKARCTRKGCRKAQVALSKYCSDWCGMESAACRLEASGIQPDRLWPAVRHAQKRKGLVLLHDPAAEAQPLEFRLPLFSSRTPPSQAKKRALGLVLGEREVRTEEVGDENGPPETPTFAIPTTDEEAERAAIRSKTASLEGVLAAIASQKDAVTANVELLNIRLAYLQTAVEKWEAMVERHEAARAAAAAAGSKSPAKRSKASKDKISNEAPCGFDVRLSWEDEDWGEWVYSDEGRAALSRPAREDGLAEVGGDNVCTITRKRCDRHQGWQRSIEASFEVEKAGQVRRSSVFAAQAGIIGWTDQQATEAGRAKSHRPEAGPGARSDGGLPQGPG
jgi:COMPASS component SPP1